MLQSHPHPHPSPQRSHRRRRKSQSHVYSPAKESFVERRDADSRSPDSYTSELDGIPRHADIGIHDTPTAHYVTGSRVAPESYRLRSSRERWRNVATDEPGRSLPGGRGPIERQLYAEPMYHTESRHARNNTAGVRNHYVEEVSNEQWWINLMAQKRNAEMVGYRSAGASLKM